MAVLSNTYSFTEAMTARFETILNDLRERRERQKVYRTTLRELNVLSSRELADIGLSRAALKSVAWEAAYGK